MGRNNGSRNQVSTGLSRTVWTDAYVNGIAGCNTMFYFTHVTVLDVSKKKSEVHSMSLNYIVVELTGAVSSYYTQC